MPRKRPKYGTVALRSQELRANVAKYLKAGLKPPAIGKALGFSRQRAHALAKEVLIDIAKQYTGDLNEIRALELSKLDALWSAHWSKGGDLGNAAILLKISERKSAILGLDVPTEMRAPPMEHAPQTSYDLSLLDDHELREWSRLARKAQRPALTQDAPPLLEHDNDDDSDDGEPEGNT